MSALLHPSGWLLLSMAAEVYSRVGLQGTKATARRASGDPKRPKPRYLVGVQLRRLYNRPRQLERVTAAFERLPSPLRWQIMGAQAADSVVRTLWCTKRLLCHW